MLTGDNGILTQANNAKIEQSHAAVKEGISLAYSEYQIEVKTGEETTDFLSFLTGKTYTESNGKIIGENLTGSKQALGNGEGTSDIYKVEGQENTYIVNYYDKNGTPQEIWNIEGSNTGTGDLGEVTLDPDTGKEALILEYQVSAGDTIELPYDLEWVEFPNGMDNGPVVNDAVFNFEVDWGDGKKESGITNANIAEKAIHQYQNEGTYDIKITGTYEVISRNYQIDSENYEYANRQGIEKLAKVKQWGTTGLKNIGLYELPNLTEIVTPTESSFKDLTLVSFEQTGIKSIPDKLFLGCNKILSFNSCFAGCTNLTTIGDYAFANCSSAESFDYCFEFCTDLTIIGDYAFANCTGVKDFEHFFYDSESLTTIGDYAFAGCNGVESFAYCFDGCTALVTIGDYAFYECSNAESFESCFDGCTSLTTIGNYAFARCSSVESFEKYFEEYTSLTTIGDYAFAGCSSVESFERCFYNCTNLTAIGEYLFEGCKNVKSYNRTFYECENLKGKAPELWLIGTNSEENYYIGTPNGENCFGGCTLVENYEKIPDYWKSTDPI